MVPGISACGSSCDSPAPPPGLIVFVQDAATMKFICDAVVVAMSAGGQGDPVLPSPRSGYTDAEQPGPAVYPCLGPQCVCNYTFYLTGSLSVDVSKTGYETNTVNGVTVAGRMACGDDVPTSTTSMTIPLMVQ
jgi:hypothetical protein